VQVSTDVSQVVFRKNGVHAAYGPVPPNACAERSVRHDLSVRLNAFHRCHNPTVCQFGFRCIEVATEDPWRCARLRQLPKDAF
jgi:hypothetical protein